MTVAQDFSGGVARVRDKAVLVTEFRRLARYVAGVEPTPYQVEKYLAFHRQKRPVTRGGFDRVLLGASREGWLGLALADAYSGFLARRSLLRAKLFVTLAILETSPPSFAKLDAPDPGGPSAYAVVAARGLAAGLTLAFALLALGPAHLWFKTIRGER